MANLAMEGAVFHQPVMLAEVVDLLAVGPGRVYVDATVGEGGHAQGILEASGPLGRVLGIDLDPRSLTRAVERLSGYGSRFIPAQGNYAGLERLASAHGITQVHGVLLDLGFSSLQIEAAGYGFSFQRDEPLDMRYDPEAALSAATIVNTYPQEELARLIFDYGEEPRARAIARAIVRYRPVDSTRHLGNIIAEAIGATRGHRIHPSTRTFQALRIAVNNELDNVRLGLSAGIRLLAPGGRLVVISYHSLEDRVVKETMVRESAGCICPPRLPECRCGHQPSVRLLTRRIIRPTPEEVRVNHRSRSARMRVAEKL